MKRARRASSVAQGNVAAFAKCVALPYDSPVVRLRDAYTATDSAVAQPFSNPVLPWSTPIPVASAGQRALAPDTSLVVLTGDPLCAAIYEDKNPSLNAMSYAWVIGRLNGANVTDIPVARGDTYEPDLMGMQYQTGTAFHGDFLWRRKFKGKTWVYCEAGNTPSANSTITVVVSGANPIAATDFVTLTFLYLNDGDERKTTVGPLPATAVGGTAATLQLPQRDYYRCIISMGPTSTTASVALNIFNNHTGAVFRHLSLPNIDDRSDDVTRLRILGASARCMNTAAEQYMAGSVVADQVEPSTVWTAYARPATDGFTQIASQRGQQIRDLKKGIYGFLKPVEEDDFAYLDCFRFDSNGDVCHAGDYNSDERPFVIFMLRAGGTADGADPARSIQLYFNYSVEYETKDPWTAVAPSGMLPDECSKAIQIIATMEQFYENPVHWASILSTVGKLARLAAPILALIPHPYAKAGAVAAEAIGSVL